jgi:hypothetical protein
MNSVTDEQKFLESYKKKIIKETLKTICKNYTIYDSDDNLVDFETIQKQLLFSKTLKRCVGTTNTSPVTQCTRNAVENYDYCRTHLYKMCLKTESVDDVSFEIEFNLNKVNECKNNLKKKLIDDSFYYIDEKFIYDTNYNKVGYIEDERYILTSDPFILETI